MSIDEALRRIDEARRTKAEHLDLRGVGMSALPPEIGLLTDLRTLDVSMNRLEESAGEVLGQLTGLVELNVGQTELASLDWLSNLRDLESLELLALRLSSLPPELAGLSELRYLGVGANSLSDLPPWFAGLTRLEQLWMWGNDLSAVPDSLRNLTSLTKLRLDSNEIVRLPNWFDRLQNLEMLELGGNRLTAFPEQIRGLSKLQELDVSDNLIERLPEWIDELTQLRSLAAGSNPLTSLPAALGRLTTLEVLDVALCAIRGLPDSLGDLQNLTHLHLADNPLAELPPRLADLRSLVELGLSGTSLPIPPEILEGDDAPAILDYYSRLRRGQRRPLNEAKLILLGQGSVGKTSLVKRLTGQGFDPKQSKTPGILITPWELQVGSEQIRLNTWDFGGQEIMHATHQFFLTKRSLYILVADSRISAEQNRLEYWLKLIQSFGADSPVLIVGNKTDQHGFDIDRRGLRKKYPTIAGFVETSCETPTGIEELRDAIAEQVEALPHLHDELLTSWFGVKEELEDLEEDYIPFSRYIEMCEEHGISDAQSRETLIGFLHDLGVVINFRDDPRLEDTNILNPEWVTAGVYSILNANILFQKRGVLDIDDLGEILDSTRYPASKHLFIVDMMRRFELCFDFEGLANRRFLVPDLLPREEPHTGDWAGSLAFEYRYEILPSSVLSRFIVRMHSHISRNTYWRTGVVLERQSAMALVRADREDPAITVQVKGSARQRRELLSIIRSQFEAIHASIPGLRATEYVRLEDHPEIAVPYGHLLELEALGEESFVPVGMSSRVSVRTLLDGVASQDDRDVQFLLRGRRGAVALPHAVEPGPTPSEPRRPSPWRSGSFYLFAAVVGFALVAALAQVVPWYVLPVALVASVVLVVIVGALQLRQDDRLQDESFAALVTHSVREIALFARKDGPPGEQAGGPPDAPPEKPS